MRKLFLAKNPHLFQGEKYLHKHKIYFEGWYFKNTNRKEGIAFIPGININESEKKAFIQVIKKDDSYYINYDISLFKFNVNPFYIKIGDNFFSKERIHVNIIDTEQNLNIHGDIEYSDSKNIFTNNFSPNIMGPFAYVPFMECNHAILSMKSIANGSIVINNHEIEFFKDTAYIEKDWGCSFPKYYVWCQGNNFENSNASFMLSIADIPFKLLHFKGIICSLLINNEEYRFATYNVTKIKKYDVNDGCLDIILKNGHYSLNVKSEYLDSFKLKAPEKGKMSREIYESICANLYVTLKKDNDIIFSDISRQCGLEIVEKYKGNN